MNREIRAYLEHCRALGHTARSIGNSKRQLGYFRVFASTKKVRTLQNVTLGLVQDYHDALIARKLKPSSRRTIMLVVKAWLGWAHESGLILSDLASRMEIPDHPDPMPPKPLTPAEVAELIDGFKGKSEPQLRARAILELLYACGLRRQELLRLNVGDVDFAEQTVLVREGKGRKDRLLPIHDMALKAVADYLATRGKCGKKAPLLVTCDTDGKPNRRLTEDALGQLFYRINRRSRKHVYPHLLRHCFAVHLLQGGADIRYVQALLGHESLETTAVYLSLVKGELKRAYDQAVESILSNE